MNYQETFKIPFELTNGNDGRGNKWFSSANLRKQFESDLRKLRMVRTPYPFPVKVEVWRVLGKGQRLWDYDSIGRGNAKEIFDALVACGWFHDDSPRYITGVVYEQDISRRKQGPFIEIVIKRDGVLNKNCQTEKLI